MDWVEEGPTVGSFMGRFVARNLERFALAVALASIAALAVIH